MDSNDHLKWLIGDLAFTVATLKGRNDELEEQLRQLEEVIPEKSLDK